MCVFVLGGVVCALFLGEGGEGGGREGGARCMCCSWVAPSVLPGTEQKPLQDATSGLI